MATDGADCRHEQINTSKGQLAKHEDLQKAFGTTDVAEIAKTILDKGELQVGGKEREAELDSLRKEISTGVAERCVDPTTQRPHTVTMIEKALNEIHFNVQPTKAVKSQVRRADRAGTWTRKDILSLTVLTVLHRFWKPFDYFRKRRRYQFNVQGCVFA
jgi:hypothetical protein